MTTYNLSSYPGVSHPAAIPVAVQDELWVGEQCREAISGLERALLAPPLQLSREIQAATRILTHMRTRIAEWLWQGTKGLDHEHWKRALSQLDAAILLLTGINLPGGGARRKPVEQARQHLQSILLEGLF